MHLNFTYEVENIDIQYIRNNENLLIERSYKLGYDFQLISF
jgi:hypothetical protein